MPSILSIYFMNKNQPNTLCQTIQTSDSNAFRLNSAVVPRTMCLTIDLDEDDSCSYEVDDTLYVAMFYMGLGFVFLYMLVAFNVKRFGQRLLFCKLL